VTTTTYTTVNGVILCQATDGVVHHFVPDPLGSVVMVRDAKVRDCRWPWTRFKRARMAGYLLAIGFCCLMFASALGCMENPRQSPPLPSESVALHESKRALIAMKRGDYSQLNTLRRHIQADFGMCRELVRNGLNGMEGLCSTFHSRTRPKDFAMLSVDYLEYGDVPYNIVYANSCVALGRSRMPKEEWPAVAEELSQKLDPLLRKRDRGESEILDFVATINLAVQFGSEETWDEMGEIWFHQLADEASRRLESIEGAYTRVKQRDPEAAALFKKELADNPRLSGLKLDQ
jgi:hypothetical protein